MIVKVPVTKGKGFVEINTDDPASGGDLPEAVYAEALAQGLKVLLNRGMTKITKELYPASSYGGDAKAAEAALQAAAMAKAAKTLEDMRAGKIRIMGAKSDKASGAVMTEARRLARNLVKDEMKRQKIKVSYVEASEITKAANALLASKPEIVEQAKANLAEREKVKVEIDVSAIPISEKRVKAAEAKKAKDKTLSAAKAGQTKKRPAKGQQPTA